MYDWIAANVLARTLDLARGTKMMSSLRTLEKSQWWPKERVIELQSKRLQELIKHAYENTPYYRRLFEEGALKPVDIRCGEDLKKLPVLNKQIIRRNFPLLQASNFPQRELISSSTSGSTGEPLAFVSTREDRHNWGYARAQRALSWSGYRIGDRMVDFHAVLPTNTTFEKLSNRIKRSFRRSLLFNPLLIAENSLPLIVQKIEAFEPKFLFGYPSAIYLLARYIQSQSNSNLKLAAVLTCDEQVYDYQKELFRQVFQCDIFSYYSSWEVYDIAGECAQHAGYHIAAENIIVEIVDEAGNPVPAGVEGRILLTNLHNYAMPFIRYDIGDAGTISDVACPCGRNGLPLLVNLNGRADSVLLTRSGKQIPGRALPQRFLAELGVAQYQIAQESYEEVVIRIILDKEYPEEYKADMIQKINALYESILETEIALRVQFVTEILPSESGKRNIFISRL